jgi:hypothetical protein
LVEEVDHDAADRNFRADVEANRDRAEARPWRSKRLEHAARRDPGLAWRCANERAAQYDENKQ